MRGRQERNKEKEEESVEVFRRKALPLYDELCLWLEMAALGHN